MFSPDAGESIDHAIRRAKYAIQGTNKILGFLFNGIHLEVSAVSDVNEVIEEYLRRYDRRRREQEILRVMVQG